MTQFLSLTTLVVKDYGEAIDFFVEKLGFELLEDKELPAAGKRWVVVAPPGAKESGLLLARAVGDEQVARVGNQTGGRVFLFLKTDNFWRDYRNYCKRGVTFVAKPREESYGTVAVFSDLYGNLWDLLSHEE